jgi:hypothetical protein
MPKRDKENGSKDQGLVRRATNTELTDWEQAEASHARDVRSHETLGIPRIQTRGAIFKIDDKPVGRELDLVVLGTKHEKVFFWKKFDPNKPGQTPDCYAFGDEEAAMVAHPQARDRQNLKVHRENCEVVRAGSGPEARRIECDCPVREGGDSPCTGCRHNAFNTAEVGRGKRCKDYRRLLVMAAVKDQNGAPRDPDADSVHRGEVRLLAVPPASLADWGMLVKELTPVSEGGMGYTRTGSVSEILLHAEVYPLEQGGHGLKFSRVRNIPREAFQAITQRRRAVESMLTQPYPDIESEDEGQRAPAGLAPRQRSEKTRSKLR